MADDANTQAGAGSEMESEWLAAMAALPPDDEVVPGVRAADVVALHRRPPDPPGATFTQLVEYGRAGPDGRSLTMALYARTDPTERRPAVVFVHGGGWSSGENTFHIRHAHELAARGYVTATISYRLHPEAKWPASIEDVKCAIRWVRSHAAEIGADPTAIAVSGGSAGGHLSAMAALTPGENEGGGGNAETSSAVQAAVLFYPATSLAELGGGDDLAMVLKEYFGDQLAVASPTNRVHGDCPPIMTITGSKDQLTTLTSIEAFHAALDRSGVVNQLVVFDGDHGFDLFPGAWEECVEVMAAFLGEHLPAR